MACPWQRQSGFGGIGGNGRHPASTTWWRALKGCPGADTVPTTSVALAGLARSAAATYSRHNIRVNCVAPGLTRTPQTK